MTPLEALQHVYNVSRLAPVPANTHDSVVEACKIIEAVITPPPDADSPDAEAGGE